MNSVEKFNALNGIKTSREDLLKIVTQAFDEQQWEVHERLSKLFDAFPDKEYFTLTVKTPAVFVKDAKPMNSLGVAKKKPLPKAVKTQTDFESLGIPYLSMAHQKELEQGNPKMSLGRTVNNNDIYKMVTEKLISAIDSYGDLTWYSGRNESKGKDKFIKLPLPINYNINKYYRGINAFLLSHYPTKGTKNGIPIIKLNPITDNKLFWMTFGQIKKHGGKLKKGSISLEAIYYNFVYKNGKSIITEEEYKKLFEEYRCKSRATANKEMCANLKKIPFLRYYNVFNERDIEGIDFEKQRKLIEKKAVKYETNIEKIEAAESIIKNMPNAPKIIERHIGRGQSPNYNPATDKVEMPLKEQYDNVAIWYGTAFHELIHSTGHKTRVGRIGVMEFDGFGSPSYAFEELVAELGSMFLNSESGILFHTLKKNAAYIKGWKKAVVGILKKDNKAIFKASGQAQKAADYILARNSKGVPKYLKNVTKQSKNVPSTTKSVTKPKKSTPQLALFGYVQTEILDVENKFKGEANSYIQNELKKLFSKFNNKKFKNLELGKDITINKVARKKTLFGGKTIDSFKATAIAYLPHLLVYGKKVNQTYNPKPSQTKKYNAKSFVHLESKIKIDGKTRYYIITVIENQRGYFKYYIEESNIKKSVRLRNSKSKKKSALSNGLSKDKSTKKRKITKRKLGQVFIDIAPSPPQPTVAVNEGAAMVDPVEPIKTQPQVATIPEESHTPKAIDEDKPKTTFSKLKELGFKMANEAPETPKNVFVLPGEIGKFLQTIQPVKALIIIKGPKHTSKSQIAMQISNAFGERGDEVAYIDYEQGGLESKDTINSLNWNTTPQGRRNIAIIGYLENPLDQLKEFCKHCKVIVADSVTDLRISADELNELRTLYQDVIWIFISQVKENGVMYGGGKMAHNPTCIIECHPSEDPKKRYATLEKNRGNDLSLAYSIYHKKLIDVDEFTDKINFPDRMTI